MGFIRLLLFRITILLLLGVVIVRLAHVQLGDTDARRYGSAARINTTRYIQAPPRRGEIYASDGTTLLAESLPIFNLAVLPGSLPPAESEQRADILGRVAQIANLTGTLVISPVTALQTHPDLAHTLAYTLGVQSALNYVSPLASANGAMLNSHAPLTVTIIPKQSLTAVDLARAYPTLATYQNPIEHILYTSMARNYQPVVIAEDLPYATVLAVRENSNALPGVIVVEHYRRRYPLSSQFPSLSHVLGYIGRIDQCELAERNPASSWLSGINGLLSSAPDCGLINKPVNPRLGIVPPYNADDRLGKDGLEASYEEQLRGQAGIDAVQVDALERPVSDVRSVQPVRHGNDLILTIDHRYQEQMEQILRRWLSEADRRRQSAPEEYKRKYKPMTNGAAIALDPRTGRILGMVSLPAYDDNVWVDPTRQNDLRSLLAPSDPAQQEELARQAPFTNRVIGGQYPAGSTLKPLVAATSLQAGIIQPDTKLFDPGQIVLRERSGAIFTLPNSSHRRNGLITLVEGLEFSSNVFFASLAGGNDQAINLDSEKDGFRTKGLGIDRLGEGFRWFGLGAATGIKLPGEATGRVPSPSWKALSLREPWTTGDTYNTAIGQGYMEITPLQLAVAMSAVANRGTMYRPQLVERIRDPQGNVLSTLQPEVIGSAPVDVNYWDPIRQGLRLSVSEGWNVAARDECSGLAIAGKTGTAEYGPVYTKPDGSMSRQSHSWFAGFAPYDNPQIVVVALIEGSGDLGDGSATLAVPAVTQMMQAYLNVTPPEKTPPTCPVLPK